MKKFLMFVLLIDFCLLNVADVDLSALQSGTDGDHGHSGHGHSAGSDVDDASAADSSNDDDSQIYQQEDSVANVSSESDQPLLQQNSSNSGQHTSFSVSTIDTSDSGVVQNADEQASMTNTNGNYVEGVDQKYFDEQVQNIMEALRTSPDAFTTRMLEAQLLSDASSEQLQKAFKNYFDQNLQGKTTAEKISFMNEITDITTMAGNMSTAILDALQVAFTAAQTQYKIQSSHHPSKKSTVVTQDTVLSHGKGGRLKSDQITSNKKRKVQ